MSSLKLRGNDLEKNLSYFIQYASNVTSQGGEDGILSKLFELIPIERGNGYCVDVGAWDGKYLSNTYCLLNNSNVWRGMLIEANFERYQELKELYESREDIICLCKYVDINASRTETLLNTFLNAYDIPWDFEFLTVDIDGADFHVWDSIGIHNHSGKVYSPKVVCIEFNPSIPNNISFTQECNGEVHQGSSLLAFVDLATVKGYELVVTTTFNAIFVRGDIFRSFIIPELARNNHIQQYQYNNEIGSKTTDVYDPTMMKSFLQLMHPDASMYSYIFQTYDGELKYTGCKKLIWHKIAMNPQQLQILPLKYRKFPYEPPIELQLEGIRSKTSQLLGKLETFKEILKHEDLVNSTSNRLFNDDQNEVIANMHKQFDCIIEDLNCVLSLANVLLPIPSIQDNIVSILDVIVFRIDISCNASKWNALIESKDTSALNTRFAAALIGLGLWMFTISSISNLYMARASNYFPKLSNQAYVREDVEIALKWYTCAFHLQSPLMRYIDTCRVYNCSSACLEDIPVLEAINKSLSTVFTEVFGKSHYLRLLLELVECHQMKGNLVSSAMYLNEYKDIIHKYILKIHWIKPRIFACEIS